MTPEDARGYIDGLSFGSKQDVWGEFPNRYDHWDAFEAFETIANLRYEYAVQVLLSDGAGGYTWHFADEDSLPFGSLKPHEVRWYTKNEAQAILDAEVECFRPKDIRIVRRLTSEPEVVE